MPTMVTSPVWCPIFSVSQVVSSGLCPSTCIVPSRSESSDMDTLTPVFEFALLVGGTDTSSRHWSPASPFPVSHSRGPRPRSPEVPGMGLRSCGPQMLGEFPTEPVTSEAHPYPPQERARRTFLYRRPVRSCVVAMTVLAVQTR
ncbi:hypothetical protein Taro_049256 [Colocasia esculenta]|uniref:Uncharacterized protein n=1 Tax=Colocasia esculenta TaxID=4460 RepID=A0A843XAE9_COLES|nr:hypothetical protein [Colocasia esculenta]